MNSVDQTLPVIPSCLRSTCSPAGSLLPGLHVILKQSTTCCHVHFFFYPPPTVSCRCLIIDFLSFRHNLGKQPPDPFHSQRGEWDLGPGGGPLSGWSAWQQGGPGAPHRAVDRYAQLRLRGLRAGSVHRRAQQGHPADSSVPEHDGHQVFVQQGDGETVRQQSLQEQRGV